MSTSLELAIARCAAGLPVEPTTVPVRARPALAVAERLGAPVAQVLRTTAAAMAADAELARAVEVAAAEGRSVARALVAVPPVLGPCAALLVTDAPFAVWSTPLGRVVLLLAVVLWLSGALVVRQLVRAALRPARPAIGPVPELLDLLGVALLGGLAAPAALRLVGAELGEAASGAAAVAAWLELGAQGAPPGGWDGVAPRLAEAARDGVPLAPLVAALAGTQRAASHQRALQRAARLGARLTLPTTLLLLPAALLVVGAPLLHGALDLLA